MAQHMLQYELQTGAVVVEGWNVYTMFFFFFEFDSLEDTCVSEGRPQHLKHIMIQETG